MVRTTPRTRLAALGAAAVATLVGGCSFANPITTAQAYAPSDGIRVPISDEVSVENLLVLTEGAGETGYVLGAVVNHTSEEVEVSLTLGEEAAPIPVTVEPEGEVNFTGAGLTLEEVAVAPGATLTSVVSTGSAGELAVDVPVLDGTLPPYDRYLDAVESGGTWTPEPTQG
ncbi:hypothetical protein GCM10023169_00040 [Georgenia halophila]|uniref:DNA modification methylase n=1 Tax=Georgenia halophila TaxID=620889 RepID=A0ABP8KTP4_9MICO